MIHYVYFNIFFKCRYLYEIITETFKKKQITNAKKYFYFQFKINKIMCELNNNITL